MRRSLACLAVLVAALAAAGCDSDDGPDGDGADGASYTRYYMPAASMEPTIAEDSHVRARDVTDYEPHDGDVVVFEDPGGWLGPDPGGMLIKRVVATPGQVLICCDDQGRLVLDGQALDEDYLDPRPSQFLCDGPMVDSCRGSWTAGPVPEGTVFVMGDNRAESADSSIHLCLPDEPDCTDDPYVPIDLVRGVID